MLQGLSEKLRQTIDKIAHLGNIDRDAVEEIVRDIQRALLSADVDVQLVFTLTDAIRKRSLEKLPSGITRKEYVIRVVYEELTNIMGGTEAEISLKPKKILLVGLYGSGKTTTAAKIARFYQKKGLVPALVCCDTIRPAAFEQLQQLAQKIDAPFYGEKQEKDPAMVVAHALQKVHTDVVIVDSSGRNALDANLITEIKSVRAALEPDEIILVIPADIGQAAKQQAEAFHAALNINHVIVTKLDATGKGGGALTACRATGSKVIFITIGETIEDLQVYNPERFVARLIGFPDLASVLEKAKSVVDEKSAEKLISGDFTIEDFYAQIESMQKMGPLSQVMDMMGMGKLATKVPGGIDVQQEKMKKWKFIIQSMTKDERKDKVPITATRITRIAKGSGTSEQDVRELIRNYDKSKKLMKKISPAKLQRGGMRNLGGLLRQFGGK
ncbi:MAG: signal recognition particle protein [Candidatus Aenigmarchaeota archaeon]|nr:signal recognition particle protein [Candidatus Aenigmarchaeota archaeon]